MASNIQQLRSGTSSKRPIPTSLALGQLAVNYHEDDPAIYIRDDQGGLVKIAPAYIGTTAPNTNPVSVTAGSFVTGTAYQILAPGNTDFTLIGAANSNAGTIFTATGAGTGTGTASSFQGNGVGEFWFDTTTTPPQLKIYDGSSWVEAGGGGGTTTTLETTNIKHPDATGNQITFTSGGDVNFDSGAVYLDSTNNRFGIGTSSPSTLLHLSSATGSASPTPTELRIATTTNASDWSVTDPWGRLSFYSADSSAAGPKIGAAIDTTATSATGGVTALDFKVAAPLTGTLTSRLYISPEGNVGLDTTSPSNTLHVAGGARFGANDTSNAYLEVGAGATGNRSAFIDLTGDTTYSDFGLRLSRGNSGANTNSELRHRGTGSLILNAQDSGKLSFHTVNSERASIDNFGTFSVRGAGVAGVSNAFSVNGYAPANSAQISSNGNLLIGATEFSSYYASLLQVKSTNPPDIALGYEGSTVYQGDWLSTLSAYSYGGSIWGETAQIRFVADGSHGQFSKPGALVFATAPNGANYSLERMKIAQDGLVTIGEAETTTNSSLFVTTQENRVAKFNRLLNDGTLVDFQQDSTSEGSISVSGTTVSYNGAHLCRWSQLLGIDPYDKIARPEILRGTVMSNLDEMCEWYSEPTPDVLWEEGDDLPEGVSIGDVKTPAKPGGFQDNEQLNKTKISDIDGDKNVAGVFQSWDDDDDTWVNDFYLAMTGDFVIRIGAGVTVKRGDLLMSAGDGTAKPQDDDIIRSKTIAKVTSTVVSETYSDGSYCVPCVLMAC